MKKRIMSFAMSVIMVLSLLPVGVFAVEENGVYVHLGDELLVENGTLAEESALPEGMSFGWDEQAQAYVLTLNNVQLTQPLSIDGWNEGGPLPVDIVLMGSSVIDIREYPESNRNAIGLHYTNTEIRSGEEGASLALYAIDGGGIDSNQGTLTINGVNLSVKATQENLSEGGRGLSGGSDYTVTGGAKLDIWGQWMGIIINGDVTFEDCTVTTNRIHVHSQVNEDDPDNPTVDTKIMTIGEGAIVNVVTDAVEPIDSSIMILDGSILKIAGGTLNCDQSASASGTIMVGYGEDHWVNTLWLDSGVLNVFREGNANTNQSAVQLYCGQFIQSGGELHITGAPIGIYMGDRGAARFEGGTALIEDSEVALLAEGEPTVEGEDKLMLSGTDMAVSASFAGVDIDSGRMTMTEGSKLSVTALENGEVSTVGLWITGDLIVNGGQLTVDSSGRGLLVNDSGQFVLLGGTAKIESGRNPAMIVSGLAELRGGELKLTAQVPAFWADAGEGDYLYLADNMFLKTEDAVLMEGPFDESVDLTAIYMTEDGEICKELEFGSSGGAFSGKVEVNDSELTVGVPFVVAADLVLGETEGTAVFTLPEGLRVKGTASVNGKVVDSAYNAGADTLTVPLNVSGAAIRFYAVANQTLEEAVIHCDVAAGGENHALTSSAFSTTGLRTTLPQTVSEPELLLSGTAAPGGLIKVYEISDDTTPILLKEIQVNSMGSFAGKVELPTVPDGQTNRVYAVKVVLEYQGEDVDSYTDLISYTTHGTKLQNLSIKNKYHGAKIDEVLENSIIANGSSGVVINGDNSLKAYNYFPSYPTFAFVAEFEDTEHIYSARLEAKGKQGQVVSIPLEYDQENDWFAAEYDFPSWAPETVAVYWVEEGVVNRESVYSTAVDMLTSCGNPNQSYEGILNQVTEEVAQYTEEYFDQLEPVQVDENTWEFFDGEDRIYAAVEEEYAYTQGMELEDGFEDINGNGCIFVKTEAGSDIATYSDQEVYTVTSTYVVKLDSYERVYQKTVYVDTWVVDVSAPPVTGGVTGATPGQRTAVFLFKQIPRIGDAVQAVDSRLLHDSLVDFDTEFANEMDRLTRLIQQTQDYRCPYTGEMISRGNKDAAIKALEALLALRVEYQNEYNKNKDQIREDMKESLMNGVTLGINKFGSKKVKAALEVYEKLEELRDEWEGYREDIEDLKEFIDDPNSKMQKELDALKTPEGLLEWAADNDLVDDETKEILETLMNPDGTYQDAHEFMIKYRDKMTEIGDEYARELQNAVDAPPIAGSGTSDCEPPDDDTPEPPGEAGGEEIPIPAIKDPSGYVYEAVESNRLSGVTTTLYYGGEGEKPTANADQLGLAPWNAEEYNQSNPLTTDALGQYQWMVPDGWWQVKYEKEGYEMAYSDWLPVPPPQTEVNIGLVNTSAPNFTVEEGKGELILVSDRYLHADSLEAELVLPEGMGYRAPVAVNTSLAPDGTTKLATRFKITYDAWQMTQAETAVVTITEAVTYAGTELEQPVSKNVTLLSYHNSVYVENSYADDSGEGQYQAGEVVTLNAGTRPGYLFDGWLSEDVEIRASSGPIATFVMPDWDVTVFAAWKEISGGNGSSGGGSGSGIRDEEPGDAEWENPFADVKNTDWYYDAVQYAYENGLMAGTGATTFSPNVTASRAMIVTILYSMSGRPEVEYNMTFKDVVQDSWYAPGVRWAAATGLVAGYSPEQFGSADPITREQLAVMLWKYAGSPASNYDIGSFIDAQKVSNYADTAISWAVETGLMSGKGNGVLDPLGNATRAEVARILMAFCSKVIQ